MNTEDFPQRERPPTPIGWSDTDWIKHLEEWGKHDQEQPHPMAGLHINQGSMDAAADAYEAEYNKAHESLLPEPQHESLPPLLASLLSHPPTPLWEILPPELALPAPETPPRTRKFVKPETLLLYARAFHELAPPHTAPRLAKILGFKVTSVSKYLRVLESFGHVRPRGMLKAPGIRAAMIWEWTGWEWPGSEPKHGAQSAPRTTT